MAAHPNERLAFDPRQFPTRADALAVVQDPPRPRDGAGRERAAPAAVDRRAVQRADLERLRRRLAEPCALEDRDLLTLLAYAVGGDGDPIVGLLDDARATIGLLGELPTGTEPNLLASLERRLAVALELYARATAGG
ncbi:MAG: hypothetical protein KF764_07275 [Labilithrix sp.]|nr:hypothetical protein [Labilithrix sp.]MBX3220236.1 hypothetical protein [Labilithrix sp.]